MHATLTLKTNLLLSACWGVIAGLSSLGAQVRSVIAAGVAVAFGLACGFLQGRSLQAESGAFLKAETAIAVRQVFMSTSAGKVAIHLQWVGVALLARRGRGHRASYFATRACQNFSQRGSLRQSARAGSCDSSPFVAGIPSLKAA